MNGNPVIDSQMKRGKKIGDKKNIEGNPLRNRIKSEGENHDKYFEEFMKTCSGQSRESQACQEGNRQKEK